MRNLAEIEEFKRFGTKNAFSERFVQHSLWQRVGEVLWVGIL